MQGKGRMWFLSKELCRCVLTWCSKQGRVGYLQLSDRGAGMAVEKEHSGGFILEAARVRRRSLGGFLSKCVRWW